MVMVLAVRVYLQMTLRDSKWGARDSIDVCHRVRESVQVFESVWAVLRGVMLKVLSSSIEYEA